MIPKIIHFIWIGSPIPGWAERNIAEFRRLNPEHEIRLHTNDSPPARYAEIYALAEHPSSKSDLIRLALLREHGGWYFDVDYWPLRPLDDVERAFALDGSKLFCAWMNNPRINNGVLACSPGCEALNVMDEKVLAGGIQHGNSCRTAFGPPVITQCAKARPELFCAAAWPWFNGVRDVHAGKVRRRCLSHGPDMLLRWLPETGGQLPFAFHLWAHTHGDKIASSDVGDSVTYSAGYCGDPLIVIFGKKKRFAGGDDRPYRAIADAVAKLGYRGEVVPWDMPHSLDGCSGVPIAAFVWNGIKHRHAVNADEARAMGAKCLFMEFGFFDRNNHFQIDHEGFLHRASWLAEVSGEPPEGADEKLRRIVGEITPVARREGYVLVLGQVAGDSQLWDSEIEGPAPLQKHVKRALLPGVKAFFRPHPATTCVKSQRLTRDQLPLLNNSSHEVVSYKRTMHGSGLADALAGARFVITINSNAANEALIAGVPVLAFGPLIGIDAGAVKATSLATLKDDIAVMMKGWRPPQAAVNNYLQWLAARQWSVDELRSPDVLKPLLAAAGVAI